MNTSIAGSESDTTPVNIRFVKNEEGKREAKPLVEIDTIESKKEIGIIVMGHREHIQTEIIEILNSHSHIIRSNVIVIQHQPEVPQGFGGLGSLEQSLQEMNKEMLISFRKMQEEISPISFEEERKTYDKNIYFIPKTQKSKVITRKYVPRKK